MNLPDIFNSNEIGKLNQLLKDEEMLKAIKKALLSGIYYDGTIYKKGTPEPLRNFALYITGDTNEKIGENIKAVKLAIELLERSFENLRQFNQEKKQEMEKSNPAR